MSDTEQRQIVLRGVGVAACAAAVSVTMPVVSVSYDTKRDEAMRRDAALRFAETEDAGQTVRDESHAPKLLEHPWLVNVEYSLKRDPNAALSRYTMRDRDGVALASITSFESRHLDRAETISAEHKCLAEAVYYEARSESVSGQLAVAEVIANRVRDHRYPNSICEVVYQGATRTTGCQFTFTCDGAMAVKPRGWRWEKAQSVAAHVLMDVHERRTGAATHYHATYVDPVWNSGLIRTNKIGAHIFYRFPQGGEWARVRNAVAERKARDARRAIVTTANAPAPATTTALSPAP
ncbi:MAG: cell wall hydrolase [Pseudomonadota bacterium]